MNGLAHDLTEDDIRSGAWKVIMTKFVPVTFAGLGEWLRSHAPGDLVGTFGEPQACPVAEYMYWGLGLPNAAASYGEGWGELCYGDRSDPADPRLIAFMVAIDNGLFDDPMPEEESWGRVTAAEGLRIWGRVAATPEADLL